MYKAANQKLIDANLNWLKELEACAPKLLGEDYSNPYYTSIPEKWFDSHNCRFLIVGEEGFGTYGCGKKDDTPTLPHDVEKIQQINSDFLKIQTKQISGKLKTSAFWRRFRKVSEHGICCWNNIDKIHLLSNKRCVLNKEDRSLLHSTQIRLLAEEISILNPTHIVFFGWHGDSLKHELPDIYNMLYPGGPRDSSVWKNNVVTIMHENRTYIFTYHPSWGYRNPGYEDKVIKAIEDSL